MPKAVAAEWFLRLFTTPDRALAIAGDMSEEGRVSITDLIRTGASLFAGNIAGAPFRLLLLLLGGVAVNLICWDLATFALSYHTFGSVWNWSIVYAVTSRIVIPIIMGDLLVRFSTHRDMTACATHAILIWLLPVVWTVMRILATMNARPYFPWLVVLSTLVTWLIAACLLLASGIRTRKRFLAVI